MSSALFMLALAIAVPAFAQTPSVSAPRDEMPALQARTVTAGGDAIVPLFAHLRFTLLVRLPADEEIVEVTSGDKEFWAVNVTGALLSVKPAKAGSATNLHIVTARGTVYAFSLSEVSGRRTLRPDGVVTVERDGAGQVGAIKPLFVPASRVEAVERERDAARQENQQLRTEAETTLREAVTAHRAAYPASLHFPYRYKSDDAPFNVRAIWHDDRRTFIRATPRQVPTLYELQGDKPALVNFDYRDGLYIVPKVLDRGYLVIGKKRWGFERAESR